MLEQYLTFWEHLSLLRRTLIQVSIVIILSMSFSFYFYQEIFSILLYPLKSKIERVDLVLLTPLEGIQVLCKICFLVALVASSPFSIGLLLFFFLPALHREEKRLLIPFLTMSFLFLLLGVGFGFFVTLPLANRYLHALNQELGNNLWSLSSYIDYTLTVLLASGFVFELCVILFFLVHRDVITFEFLHSKRRHAILLAFILGAILTPPDILSQVLLALPLIGLYECILVYARLRKMSNINKKRVVKIKPNKHT